MPKMASKTRNTRPANSPENDLLTALAHEQSSNAEIEARLSKYRSACEAFVFSDFEAVAAARDIERRLWSAHTKINNRYRSSLAKFHNCQARKRPVERRKLEKDYLSFIKGSTKFYRGFIQRLASHFDSPIEVLEIAHKLHLNTLSADIPVRPSQSLQSRILDSCHATLVQLGDLSRYRETEIFSKDRNWRPAKGYYELATTVKPSSGASYNQLAVIARADGDHIGAVYNLYRALSTEIPYPMARENLQAELKKFVDSKSKGLLKGQEANMDSVVLISNWLVYLHAKLHIGSVFPQHEELEEEFLTYLSVELKERPLSGLLNKVALSNIAAQHVASNEAKKGLSEHSAQVYILFLRLNIKTFLCLLQILTSEVETKVVTDEGGRGISSSAESIPNGISTTIRRIAPCLRHYSSWLLSNAMQLVAVENQDLVGVHLSEFWRIYAKALTLLAVTFRHLELPDIEYLLGEDEDTVAFTPFTHSSTRRRYLRPNDVSIKPRIQSHNTQRQHPHLEVLFRLMTLLEDGTTLVRLKIKSSGASIPLVIVDGSRFEVRE